MAYPILAPKSTWFAPTNSSVTRSIITEIEIMDSYTPDASVTVVDSWDASAAKDGSITCYVIGAKLIIAGNGSGKIAANEDSSYFSGNISGDRFSSMTSFVGTNYFDTSEVTNMAYMFAMCVALTSIDVSTWNVSKVTNMEGTFGICSALNSIVGLNNWDVHSSTTMALMFFRTPLISIDISSWDVSSLRNMSQMFANCSALISIDISSWDVSSLLNMSQIFTNCSALTSLDLSAWNVSKVTDMSYVFWGCEKLITVGNLSNWDVSNVTTIAGMFANCALLESIGNLSNWDVSNVNNMSQLFGGCWALASVGDLSGWDVSNVTTVKEMFHACVALLSVGNITNWNTSNITTMRRLFNNCLKLTGIGDLANWDVSNVTDMSFMFWSASSVKEIDVSKWNVSKVTNFDHFAAHAGLRRKGIENWKTTSATNMNALFHNCAEEELDLSGWDVSKVQFFCQMFENSPNLKRIKGLEKWNTSAGLGFDGMFERCYKLEELDLSSFDTSKAKNGVDGSTNGHKTATLNNMFLSCNNLKKVKVGPNFSINGDGTNTTAANKAILPTPSTDYIEGADGMWYAFNGEPHAPNAIKDKTAETYFASYALCADQDIIVKNGSMIEAAKAIREKNGTTDHYTPAQFGAAIRVLN